MPSIELSFTVAAAVAVLLVVAAGVASWIAYRYTLPPVPRWKRLLLTTLRGTALALVLLLLCEPFLRLVTTETRDPALAVLVDVSRSMGINDQQGDRAATLAALLRSGQLKDLPRNGTVLFGTFGATLRPLTGNLPDSLALNDDATDISSALSALAEQRERLHVRAALLITDGVYSVGRNPLHVAEQLGIPLFTVGIGDSSEQKDLLITRVATNELVYAETEVPVDVTVKSTGYAGRRVEVILQQGTRELARSTVTLDDERTREYPVRLTYVPEGEGSQRYTVRVSTLEGELTTENNRRSFFARVLKSRLRVLILAGGPSPDLSIVRQTLAEERHLQVQSYTVRAGGGFYEGALRLETIDSADCFLTIGFPTAGTPDELLRPVQARVSENRTPVFYVDGPRVDENRLRTLPTLPFTASGLNAGEQYAFLQPVPAQQAHPVLGAGAEAWAALPPIFRRQGTFRQRPEAQMLGTFRTGTINTPDPMLLARSVNGQKSLAVLGHGIWRWRLMAQNNPATERFLSAFLVTGIRWLTTREDDRPVKIVTTRDQYTPGEPVEFLGQVYDAGAAPVDGAEVSLTARREGREVTTTLRPIGNGRYEGRIEGLEPGEYAYRGTATLGGQALGEDRGKFSVGELDLEFVDTRMNIALLRQMAARSGGTSYLPGDLAALRAALAALPSFAPDAVRTAEELELWNWRVMLGVIVLLLGVEWFVRKRSGML